MTNLCKRGSLCAVALLAPVLFAATFPAQSASFPERELALADGRVTLIRDSYGTPHLYAKREEDAFFGLGYAYGEDRLRQVLASYLQVQGRLAEKFGAGPLRDVPGLPTTPMTSARDTVASDLIARRFRFLEGARHNFRKLPPQLQKDMTAFIHGLQRYMRDHPEDVPEWAPELEPALPIAQLSMMTMLEFPSFCDARIPGRKSAARMENPFLGSNAWVAGGDRTQEGRVYFSSDSHGPLEGDFGTTFYNFRIKAGTLDALSFDVAGAASFFFGHSSRFAWGWTEGKRLVADCYRVRTQPGHPGTYLYDGVRRHMEQVPYSIAVKGGTPRTGSFFYTDHNGVRSPVIDRDGDIAYVVSSPYFGREGLAAGEYYAMMTARNRQEFEVALAQREIYSANLIIGGNDGLLMYIRPGRIPIRRKGIDAEELLDGNVSATSWRGVHGYAELLKLVDPSAQYIANANVSPDRMYPQSPLQPENYPSYYGFERGLVGARQLRFIELLEQAHHMTADQGLAVVMDDKLFGADRWGPVIARAMTAQPKHTRSQPEHVRHVLETLAGFDGHFSRTSSGALYFAMLRGELTRAHAEEVDAIAIAIGAGKPLSAKQDSLLLDAAATIADALQREYGRVDLVYGDLHRIGRGSVDLPVGGTSIAGGYNLPDRRSMMLDGKRYSIESTIRLMEFEDHRLPTAKKGTARGGERIPFFVAFTYPLQSYSAVLPGISDRATSPHFSDQARLASEGRLKPTFFHLPDLLRNKASLRELDTRYDAGSKP